MDFSIFFFSNYNVSADNKYQLLLKAVKYADQAGFSAVWTPERHFHEFGGLFPNPSVISSALAMVTEKIALRSGSLVSPLHDVIRIAEEWSVVDNLSNGRVALSFASGWNAHDFVLSPASFASRHQMMIEQIETVSRLWRGESIKRPDGLNKEIDVCIFPRPVQKELPVWVTAAGNENTYRMAGEGGFNLLTHLLGQDIEDLSYKISVYREAWNRHGHAGQGKVALMLHTFIGDNSDEIQGVVFEPFKEYLKSATSLSRFIYEEAGYDFEDVPKEDKELMLNNSVKRYIQTSSLIGTKTSCADMVDTLCGIGVDEIACLIDFGIDENNVMESLHKLRELQTSVQGRMNSVTTLTK